MKKSFKGKYTPANPSKYVGDPTNIIYRSLLERRMMVYLDKNPDIDHWASEELPIRYYSPIDNKWHRYFPDFIVRTKQGKKLLIEIKPSRQCVPPKKPTGRKTRSYMRESFEYIRNKAKWQAATKYCKDNGAEFKIITEKDLS
tara:strand:- start:32349 stop:32777 length:429 start_codon:yes stop_codon:yes gene_type:complete